MQQTPVHEDSNPDLLGVMPLHARRIVEIGCSSGALARDYKLRNPGCWYLGCDIDASYVDLARRHCDEVKVLDIDQAPENFYSMGADVWVFGDTLEHMKDPWAVLRRVRESMQPGGVVVACIPNAQHWSVQVRLNVGEFRYEASGLLDRTHLRWFTRKTILQMFAEAGFAVDALIPRVFVEPGYDVVAPVIEELAEVSGADPREAVLDARPLQYVIRATVPSGAS
ncbi:class I SAM-dependent methyltransferase [Aquabacterium sp. G14]|uniref:class I SAM-dependent methyltransferase n=1 Tax=Aquabacterium sp. G14 TaxID=3130164 RepID=UPI0030B63D8A